MYKTPKKPLMRRGFSHQDSPHPGKTEGIVAPTTSLLLGLDTWPDQEEELTFLSQGVSICPSALQEVRQKLPFGISVMTPLPFLTNPWDKKSQPELCCLWPGARSASLPQVCSTSMQFINIPHLKWMDQNTCSFVVQLLSCVWLCNPIDLSTPGFPVHHQLPEFMQTHIHQIGDAIQPSHPLSSPSPPAFNLSQHQGLLQWVSSSYQVAKVLEFQLQHQSFQWISRTDFL